ncbi:MAG: DUF47 family protein [Chloroflexota bacterium]|nr:DUF47 family protein [Chloroflexota bacterium]
MVLGRFLPRDERFFDYFREVTANTAEAAALLLDIFQQSDDVDRKVRRLRDLEHRTDEVTHSIFNALNSTFVTPIDRDDIQELASKLDDFMDFIEELGSRLQLYKLYEATDLSRLLARIISEQAQILSQVVPLLEHAKHYDGIRQRVVEIHRLENEADDALTEALGSLYDGATDIPSLVHAIRWGELYQLLEDATDGAEDVADVLESIVLKNA